MRAFTPLIVSVACACTPGPSQPTPDLAQTEAFGPERQLWGRVHDVADHNRGMPNVLLSTDRDETSTDLLGDYRIAASTSQTRLFLHVEDTAWTPVVMHIPAYDEDTPMWSGLIPLEDTERMLSVVATTTNISPTFRHDAAYVIVQVHLPNKIDRITIEHVDVRLHTPDDPLFPDAYYAQYNDALSTCLPVRGQGGVARALPDCGGLTAFPEVPAGVEVEVEVEAFEGRLCARSVQEAATGEGAPTARFRFVAEPGYLNVVNALCHNPT